MAVSDFSGLTSSAWALLASAAAKAATDLLDRRIGGSPDFERLPRTPCPIASLASSGIDIHWQKIRTDSPLERIMRKTRRRSASLERDPADGFGLLELRLIESSHVHVALGGPCDADDVTQSRMCDITFVFSEYSGAKLKQAVINLHRN